MVCATCCHVSGDDSELAHEAWRVMKELTVAMPLPMQSTLASGASQCQFCRAFQRVALDAFNCIGVGVHHILHNCWDLSQLEYAATHMGVCQKCGLDLPLKTSKTPLGQH
eukprot:10924908-Lingulodinium_polyedra.AAC.1